MAFYRGQKVTMVREWPKIAYSMLMGEEIPQFGKVYTIRDFYRHSCGLEGLYLQEIRNAPRMCLPPTELSFSVEWFRPVVDLPACLTELQDIKNHKPIKEPAMGPEAFV